ncbi:MAG: ATP-binding protein [bacterium]
MQPADEDGRAPRTAAPSGGALRSFRRTPLSFRLAIFSAALAALVTCATFVALSMQVRTSTRTLFADELARNNRTLVNLQRTSRRQLVLTAALLAESPTLRSAIATYRVEQQAGAEQRADLTVTVQDELEKVGRDLNGGVLLATDEHGRVFAGYTSASPHPMAGEDLSALPAIRNALDPAINMKENDAYLSGLEVGGHYFSVGAAPLILDGYTIGTIVFGTPVDSSLVASLRTDFATQVVIAAGTHVVGSTLPAVHALEAARDSGGAGRLLSLGNDEYVAGVVHLGRTQLGTDLRVLLLQPLTPAVAALTSALRRDFIVYGVLAVVFAGLGAALLSRSLLRPLRGFIYFMHEGANRDDVHHEFNVDDASLEIRALNLSFNRLMASVRGKREELERRGTELAAANEVLTDEIKERQRVERALRESEAQLRQSQKLEAIGTLAGGIAHDFNNMLTVISGFTQMALMRLGKEHEAVHDLKQVSEAAHSAAGLTHQLLAFSRKQVMQPRVLDLEQVVDGMESMLHRLIGSHIALEVVHSMDAARIKADPGQLEQVLLNLAVNARDAMPEGGTLTIEIGFRRNRTGAQNATLSVRDTGVGIPPAVRDRIFEPFFTTKEVGKGTGLGLSTVYGIVAQSGGTIEVESTVGVGTTFTVAFPIATEYLVTDVNDDADAALPRGTETILLVDDEDAVLEFARRTLEECGYTVVKAHSGVEALTIVRADDRIDVLLTDIIMPQLTGPQLVERYLAKFAEPCIIYMTGYMDDETMRVELDEDVVLLRKPFSAADLARTVRTTLDARAALASAVDAG